MPMKLVVAISISSHVLSFIAEFTLSRTTVLYIGQFVCEVCSRGAGCRTKIVVLMVNDGDMIGRKVVTCLDVSVCGIDAVRNEEIQEFRYFVGVCGPVCRRPS